jgi:hypothetical protein
MTALGTSGGASANNPGALTYTARTFKDFHLQLKYRATQTSNNGGVLLRNGEQAAILDNGNSDTRTGAIVGLAPNPTPQHKPTREWNTLDVIAYGDRITSLVNGVRVASAISTRPQEGTIALENAANNLMYADVRIKELTTDTTNPTVALTTPREGQVFLQGAPDTPVYDCADDQDLAECVATPFSTSTPGRFIFTVTARDAAGNETVVSRSYSVVAYTTATQDVSATVPATLTLTLGGPASFGAFQPGQAREYTATTTANVVSTAGDAALTVSDPGHLANGAFTLPQPLRVEIAPNSWNGPVSNGRSTITFRQAIGMTDAVRTGTYSRTLTFTLSTATP